MGFRVQGLEFWVCWFAIVDHCLLWPRLKQAYMSSNAMGVPAVRQTWFLVCCHRCNFRLDNVTVNVTILRISMLIPLTLVFSALYVEH